MNRTEKTTVVESLAERFAQDAARHPGRLQGIDGRTGDRLAPEDPRRRRDVPRPQEPARPPRLRGTAVGKIADRLKGTCGLAAHATDPVALAKVVSEFAKDHPQFRLVACVVDAKDVYGAEGIKQLATLPGRQELRAQLLALINTPATQLVRLINTPAGQVARAVDARREKLEGGAA